MDQPIHPNDSLGTLNSSDEVGYHYKLGNQHLYENRLEAAIREYQRVVMLNPQHVQAHFEMGTAYFREGNLEMSVRAWQEACALVPNFVRAHYSLGLAYERQGKREKAITELQVALKIVQIQNDSTGERRIQQELERLQGTEDFLRQVQDDPKNVEARYSLGLVYFRQGKNEQAIEEFEKAIELND